MIEKIFENEELLVIIKPQGVNSEDGKQQGIPSLLEFDGQKPLVVHRLDREVGGIMVLAKDKSGAARISKQITDGDFNKEYLAIVLGETEDEGRLCDLLFHDRFKNKTYVVDRKRAGVKQAELEFRRLASTDTKDGVISLLLIKLLTGRTHQIRVQFASRRLPLLGDRKYGSTKKCPIALFSHRVTLFDKKGQKLCLKALPKEQYPWNEFSKNLKKL